MDGVHDSRFTREAPRAPPYSFRYSPSALHLYNRAIVQPLPPRIKLGQVGIATMLPRRAAGSHLLHAPGAFRLTADAHGCIRILKLKIVEEAYGTGGADGDGNLESYQDLDTPWLESVIGDFERLIARAS